MCIPPSYQLRDTNLKVVLKLVGLEKKKKKSNDLDDVHTFFTMQNVRLFFHEKNGDVLFLIPSLR